MRLQAEAVDRDLAEHGVEYFLTPANGGPPIPTPQEATALDRAAEMAGSLSADLGIPAHRRFILERDEDPSGIAGTGRIAEGVLFTNGVVALRWTSEWPTSVVFYDRGIEAVEAVHGHGGSTRIVWLDGETADA
jgi:hypothetical protein